MFHKIYMLILCVFNSHPDHRCRLHPRTDFFEPVPVFLRNGKLLEPDDDYGNVNLIEGESLTVSCEGSGAIYHPQATREVPTASITCGAGDNFRNDEWLNFPARFCQFRCTSPPNHLSQRVNRSCFDGNAIYEVGYKVQDTFYPAYESCFSEVERKVIYSKYTQKPFNFNFQTGVQRPYFISNDVYGLIPVESLFTPGGLKAAVERRVGPLVDNYVTKAEMLSRGHLAAKTDFVFAFGQRASFHYVNCAPQWTGFNGGNWNTLEVDLRNYVHSAKHNVIIYTGTYGVTQLLDQSGRRVDIYLYTDENNNPLIPVPLYFYKVVYDPVNHRGIAFVGINNPYYTLQEARELAFCQDICRGNRNFSWLTWRPNNPSLGYSFCCNVSAFTETVKHLPELEVESILI